MYRQGNATLPTTLVPFTGGEPHLYTTSAGPRRPMQPDQWALYEQAQTMRAQWAPSEELDLTSEYAADGPWSATVTVRPDAYGTYSGEQFVYSVEHPMCAPLPHQVGAVHDELLAHQLFMGSLRLCLSLIHI